MKGDAEKCHLIMRTNVPVGFELVGSLVRRGHCEKRLGFKTDYNLNFDEHVKTLCGKANNEPRVLLKATPYISIENTDELFFQRSV